MVAPYDGDGKPDARAERDSLGCGCGVTSGRFFWGFFQRRWYLCYTCKMKPVMIGRLERSSKRKPQEQTLRGGGYELGLFGTKGRSV